MGPGWVAGAVRGRAIAARRLGPDAVTMLARTTDLGSAVEYLGHSGYGHRLTGVVDLGAAQHAVGETALWHLRVLAGWLPPAGAEVVRVVAGWFEAQNLLGHALRVALSAPGGPPYHLGALGTVWGHARTSTSLEELAGVLRSNGWGQPIGHELEDVLHAIAAGWGRRLADGATGRPEWGEALVAVEVAKSLLVEPGRPLGWRDRLTFGLGPDVDSIGALEDRLPGDAAWVLDGIEDLRDAEARWWDRVDGDVDRGLMGWGMDRSAVTCAGMALVTDAHRVQAMLAAAWRRGGVGAHGVA